jgi:dienelactone hydrolase
MPVQERPFAVENRRGDLVYGDVRYDARATASPVVVMCHGFKGFKDWGPFPAWGRYLAEAGFTSVLLNFSYNGVGPGASTEFTRLDRFADNTFMRELDDLEAVLTALVEGRIEAPADADRLGLMGHSRGGAIVILHAAADPRIRALATWSSVAGLIERFSEKQRADWKRQGYTEIRNARTNQTMRLNRILYDDALAHRAGLDVKAAAARVAVPWLIVHAEDDAAVPLTEAEALRAAAPDAAFFEAGGGHTFGGRHPYDGASAARRRPAPRSAAKNPSCSGGW